MLFLSDPDTKDLKSAETLRLEKTKMRMIRSARASTRKRVRTMLTVPRISPPLRVRRKISAMRTRTWKMTMRALLPT